MTMEYEDSNRAFVQAFLARNVLTFDQAKPILAAIFSVHEKKQVDAADINKEDFDSMVSAANAALSPLDFEIRSADDQETRETFYALVNTTSDALTQLATIHSSDEIGYVKRLLDEIFETSNTQRREAMCIAGKDALNLARAGRRATQNDEQTQPKFSLTAHEVETLLTKLVAEGWLDKSAKGFYSLSIRGLMELKGWLVETYNDPVDEDGEAAYQKIKFCHACKGIITKVSIAFLFRSKLTRTGSEMLRLKLLGPPARHMHAAILSSQTVPNVSSVQQRVGWKALCGRKSDHNLGQLSSRKKT